MKHKLLPLVLAVGITTVATSSTVHASSATGIGSIVVGLAKDSFLKKTGSLLFDPIFGLGGPKYVNLSEASLQEIQNRVRQELVRVAEFEFFADFDSLEAILNEYNNTLGQGNSGEALLNSLSVKTSELMNHYALNSAFNDDYFYLADSYALAATLAMSVHTERNINGFIDDPFVQSRGDEYGTRLETMVDAKRAAVWPLREECESSDPYAQYDYEDCTLVDPFGNILASQVIEAIYPEDWDIWYDEVAEVRATYYEENIGELEDIILELKSF